jgi:hypothetical protein
VITLTARRYGFLCGLLVALILLLGLEGSPVSGGGMMWDAFVAGGYASAVGLAAMALLARAGGTYRLPASFFHALHVYAARLTAAFALAHAVLLVVYEPALLADLRLGGPIMMWSGGGSLFALMLLAWIPWRDCKSINERSAKRAVHLVLALLAGSLSLVHVLAGRYRDLDWRHASVIALIAGAAAAIICRRAARREIPAPTIDLGDADQFRLLARKAALVATLIVLTVLVTYAMFG